MSFASILSEPTDEPAPRRSSPMPPPSLAPTPQHRQQETPSLPRWENGRSSRAESQHRPLDSSSSGSLWNGSSEVHHPNVEQRMPKPRRPLTAQDYEAINRACAEIDMGPKSDLDEPGFEEEYERYIIKGKKRAREILRQEAKRRKVRPKLLYLFCFMIRPLTNMTAPSPFVLARTGQAARKRSRSRRASFLRRLRRGGRRRSAAERDSR